MASLASNSARIRTRSLHAVASTLFRNLLYWNFFPVIRMLVSKLRELAVSKLVFRYLLCLCLLLSFIGCDDGSSKPAADPPTPDAASDVGVPMPADGAMSGDAGPAVDGAQADMARVPDAAEADARAAMDGSMGDAGAATDGTVADASSTADGLAPDGAMGVDMGPARPDAGQGAMARRAFSGAIEGTNVFAGMVVQNGRLSFYTCGIEHTLNDHTAWWSADIPAEGGEIVVEHHAWTLRVTRIEDNSAEGMLTNPDGHNVPWRLNLAHPDTGAGLYAAPGDMCRHGLILVDDGGAADPRAQGAWCEGEGVFLQVTPVRPLAITPQGVEVYVDREDGRHHFFMEPVVLEPRP